MLKRGQVGSRSLNAAVLFNPEIVGSAPVNAVASAGVLTLDTQPIVGKTMTIGTTVYTFTTDGTAASAGEIDVGADLADAKTLVIAAINGTDGNNDANAFASAGAFAGDDLPVTALVKGVAGDAIVTTDTLTGGTNGFAAATLGSGVDGTDAELWATRWYNGKLYLNVSPVSDRGVLTDTWYSLDGTIVS